MKWILVILLAVPVSRADAQNPPLLSQTADSSPHLPSRIDARSSIQEILNTVERAVHSSSMEDVQALMGRTVFLTIGQNVQGYHSAYQAVSILSEYLSSRRLVSFEYIQIQEKASMPFAVGRMISIHNAVQETVRVYISFRPEDSSWVINQFNIY